MPVSPVTIPSGAKPRRGVRLLVENSEVTVSQAVDVLDPDTETTLADVSDDSA
jgi:hypothetical protein